MTVQDTLRVAVPRQAGPVEPPAVPVPAPPPLLGKDRPWTQDEREFALVLVLLFAALTVIIATGLVFCQYVWS